MYPLAARLANGPTTRGPNATHVPAITASPLLMLWRLEEVESALNAIDEIR